MPVSNICERGPSWSNAGALRWISQWSSTSPMSSVSSGRPSTLKTCPSTASPTGTEMPLPVLRTAVPRTRPSVACMHTQRTRPSPICWATSAVTVSVVPSSSRSISTAMLISGNAWGGNSTSTTGPVIATTRPSSNCALAACVSSVIVVTESSSLRVAERLGPADDFHDLCRDRVLAGAVHDATQRSDELVRVVRRGGHRPLLRGEERGRRLEQRREDLGLDGARGQIRQQLLGVRLELGVAPGATRLGLGVLAPLGQRHRQQLLGRHGLSAGREEPRRGHEQQVDGTREERGGGRGRLLARVGERRPVVEADEGPLDVHLLVAEVPGGLLADG